MKKRIVSGLLIFLLLVSASFLVVYGIDGTHTFSEIVESGDLSNLRLTIYYLRGLDYIRETPISIRELKSIRHFKIVVKGSDLEKNLDSLKELSREPIMPSGSDTPVDAYVYYEFETKLGHKLYDVTMWTWSDSSCICVNGVIVKDSDIFYDVIMPYLPQDIALEFKDLINRLRE